MSDARAEAERRWPHDWGVPELALSRARYRVGFRNGAKWQAEQSATRIAELEEQLERYKLAHDIVQQNVHTVRMVGYDEEFDRWLAAHDREVAAKALDDASTWVWADKGQLAEIIADAIRDNADDLAESIVSSLVDREGRADV